MITQILNNVVKVVGKRENEVYIGKNEKDEVVEVHFSDYFIADYYKDKVKKDTVTFYDDGAMRVYNVYVTPFALNKGVYDPQNLIASVWIDNQIVEFYKLTGENERDYHYAKSENKLIFLGWFMSKNGLLVLKPSLDPDSWYELDMVIPVENTPSTLQLCM